MLCRIIYHGHCQDILLDIGMYVIANAPSLTLRPIKQQSNYYNCRVIAYSAYIYLIRPKLWLANEGNYRERRYFQCWRAPRYVGTHDIPMSVWPLLRSKQV